MSRSHPTGSRKLRRPPSRVFDELQPVLSESGLLHAFAASRNDTGVAFTDALIEDVRLLFAQV
jgi:hypothetical protein